MKYFFDTEFLEGSQKTFFGNTKPTIDLISIGMVDENNREFYAISKDFNLKEAWYRHELVINKHYPMGPEYNKVYWIRENILKPIYVDLYKADFPYIGIDRDIINRNIENTFSYSSLKALINKYGHTNKDIAGRLFRFIHKYVIEKYDDNISFSEEIVKSAYENGEPDHDFFAYYASYDWVSFCWLFGKMIDLPKGIPMYCKDLKQIMDEKGLSKEWKRINCPDPINEHNALVDAKWNLKLYNLLQ